MERVSLKSLNKKLNFNYDIFICSASFEERCLSISKNLKNKSFLKTIIFENETGSGLLRKNADSLENLWGSMSVRKKINLRNSLGIAEALWSELKIKNKRGKMSVLIDITSFNHEVLLVCLKILLNSSKVTKITCVYNNASEYCPNVDIGEKWLSKGAELAHPVLGYPGILLPTRKTHLIIVVGYEYSRAFQTISDLEPSSITLVYGSDNDCLTEKDKEANKFFNDIVVKMAFEYKNIERTELPCSDPEAMSDGLKKLYDSHREDNVIIIPMNSKMSTVGVCVSLMKDAEPQVCYAPAILYNEDNYSLPGKYCCIYDLKG